MKPQRHLREAERTPTPKETTATPPQPASPSSPHVSRWHNYFTEGIKRMANGEEKTFQNIPFPIFAWLMGITIAAVWAFAALNSTVQSMNSAMLIRDAQYARERESDEKRNTEERQKLEQRIAEQQAYINQFRVEIARMQKGR